MSSWTEQQVRDTEIDITAYAQQRMAPVKDAPPFWIVGAPIPRQGADWARRRLFAHAAPTCCSSTPTVASSTAATSMGAKYSMVFFDGPPVHRQNGALTMQVLQKAQHNSKAKGVEIVFAQIKHPQERDIAPMNDTDLACFFPENQVGERAKVARCRPRPCTACRTRPRTILTRVLGLEGAFTFLEAIGEAPNIFVIDEHGMIRWHSAGTTPDPSGEIPVEMVYTMNAAVFRPRTACNGDARLGRSPRIQIPADDDLPLACCVGARARGQRRRASKWPNRPCPTKAPCSPS